MRFTVVKNLVVYLVGVDDQPVLAGDGDDLQQHAFRVKRSGRIIGIDDDDGSGTRRNLGTNVREIRQPLVCLVTKVMPGSPTGNVITSYSIHYTKLYDICSCIIWACFIRPAIPPFIMVRASISVGN